MVKSEFFRNKIKQNPKRETKKKNQKEHLTNETKRNLNYRVNKQAMHIKHYYHHKIITKKKKTGFTY